MEYLALDPSLSEDIVNFVCDHIDTQLLRKAIHFQVMIVVQRMFYFERKLNFPLVNCRTDVAVCGKKDIVLYFGPCTIRNFLKVVFWDSFPDF